MKSLLIFIALAMSFLFSACGDNGLVDDCSSVVEINQVIGSETGLLSTALTNFSTDQSQENCDNVVDAYNSYIDALKSLQGCANEAGVGTEFAQSLSDAENNLDDFGC